MAQIELEGKVFELDGDGFLTTPEVWNDQVAELFAKSDGIEELTEKHWAVVRVIRKNFEEKGNAPMIRTICQETGLRLKEIYELFPLGPARGACRVAGLPKPDGCV
ncbi:MAG: TusE/DsrC/DsvC family sulfur relay protein [Bacteroidales bacterium]|jgi:tRNA 2-thiouridine synthesizing protein E|nr:TusE/DsrC/DsvC family sulfur relay protein [Bacteroidales bacterium]MDD2425941.1 TusE/DsrC/DsvC family sulfur relay protein [Bacteroidales bacterium]MDD3989188.1 TusE/DsrC/DsvC family sulfur relay protein [Bacteroidales bacterium]MDD4639005.1 TusE/DsrC/DsvC family sulfur relay protein [Bacteroidales bacterium]